MKRLLYLSYIGIYFVLLLWVAHDRFFFYRWYQLGAYILLLSAVLVTSTSDYLEKAARQLYSRKSDVLTILVLFDIGIVVNTLLGSLYPFVPIGDEVRDSGLDAMRIAYGSQKDLFNFGNYHGYGRIIPVFSSFFFYIFHNSVWTYRFPALLVSTLDIVLLYVLLRLLLKNKLIAALGALTLAVLPLHLFYTRTELVDIFDSFWTTALLLCFYLLQRKRSLSAYILLGTVAGLASTFHTASRITAILIYGVAVLLCLYETLEIVSWKRAVAKVSTIFVMGVFFLIGFGPMILNTTPNEFFQRERVPVATAGAITQAETLVQRYAHSLMVVGFENTTSRFPVQPLLPPAFVIFLVLGIIFLFKYGKPWMSLVLLLSVFVLPFTNSAMTDWINADHRLLPMLPIFCVIIAYGYFGFWKLIPHRNIKAGVLILIGFYIAGVAATFFALKQADNTRGVSEFLSTHVIRTIRENNIQPQNETPVCIVTSTANYDAFRLIHHREQFEYFLNQMPLVIQGNNAVPQNEAYITRTGCNDYSHATHTNVVECGKNQIDCPESLQSNLIIHYD